MLGLTHKYFTKGNMRADICTVYCSNGPDSIQDAESDLRLSQDILSMHELFSVLPPFLHEMPSQGDWVMTFR